MTEDYKSSVAKSADIEYGSSYDVSRAREEAIIKGISFSGNGSTNPYHQFEEEIRDYQKQIADVTIPSNNRTMHILYAIGDKVGLTSPKSRLQKISQRSAKTSERLEGKISGLWKKIDHEDEKLRELRTWKYDAGILMDKYEAMKKKLMEDTEKMKNDVMHLSDELQKTDDGSAQYISLSSQLDKLTEAKREMESDLTVIDRKYTRAASAFTQFWQRIHAGEKCRLQFQKLQNNYENLRNKLQMQATQGETIWGSEGVVEGMREAGHAYSEIQSNDGVLKPVGQASDQMLLKSTKVFVPESVDLGDKGALKELQRDDTQQSNSVIKLARELRRQEIFT